MDGKEINLEDFIKIKKSDLKLAVIGHTEWINFLEVDHLPKAGIIGHSIQSLELPAGGAVVIAKTLKELTNNEVHFFSSLGNDFYGKKSYEFLERMGIKLHIAWRDIPTRRGFSLVDKKGERSITIIGKRLQPAYNDNLNWGILKSMDGIFITAADKMLFRIARASKILCSTPRTGLDIINDSKVELDALLGSNLDPGEKYSLSDINIKPRLIIKTEGKSGGILIPGGRYKALSNTNNLIDSYGCGDSFAAGILYGLSSNWNIEKTLTVAKILGRNCSQVFGPYANIS